MKESITMQDWLKTWERPVKKSSLKTYKSYERAHIIPFWGQIHLDKITGADLKKFKNFLSKKLAGKTVQDILSYLNTILQDAEKQGHLVRPELPKVKVPQREKEILDYREHKMLSQWLRQSTSPKDVGILLALSTGMRLGEVLGLRQKDIDLDTGVLHVRHNRQRIYNPQTNTYPVEDLTPKTQKSRRDIPLHPGLRAVLKNYMATQKKPNKNQPLIVAPTGKAYDSKTMAYRFDQLKKELNLNPGLTFHSLRHSFATRALELGLDMGTVSVLLGHSSVSFTLSRYSHCVTEQKRRQMEKIAECF